MAEKMPKRDLSYEKTMLDGARALKNSWLGPQLVADSEQDARMEEVTSFVRDIESQIIRRGEAKGESKAEIDATLEQFKTCRLYYLLVGSNQPPESAKDRDGNPLPLDFSHPEIGENVIMTFLKKKSDGAKF